MKMVLRIIHCLALFVILYVMAISVLEWVSLERYRYLGIRNVFDIFGLLVGTGLCAVALWVFIRKGNISPRNVLGIYIGLFLIFVWFLTILYPYQHPGELHTLDPRRIEQRESSVIVSWVASCLITFALLSIGPILKIRELHGRKA